MTKDQIIAIIQTLDLAANANSVAMESEEDEDKAAKLQEIQDEYDNALAALETIKDLIE